MIFDTIIGKEEVEVRVTYTFSPGMDAKTYGPMENSSEEEPPEIEIQSVMVFGRSIWRALSPDDKEQIKTEALDHAVGAAIDHAEIEADRAGDEQRELQHWDEYQ